MENDQSLQWLGEGARRGCLQSREGKRKARRWVALNGSEVLECRENRLHTDLRADVLHAKVVLSRAGLHPAHFLAFSLVLSRSGLHGDVSQQHLGDWGCKRLGGRLPLRERPGLRLDADAASTGAGPGQAAEQAGEGGGRWPLPSDIACTLTVIHMGKMNRILKVPGALGSYLCCTPCHSIPDSRVEVESPFPHASSSWPLSPKVTSPIPGPL